MILLFSLPETINTECFPSACKANTYSDGSIARYVLDSPPILVQRLGGDLDGLLNTIRLARVDLLASLCDLLEDGIVGEGGDDLGGLVLKGHIVALDTCKGMLLAAASGRSGRIHTVELLEDSIDGTGAAAAAHGDIELVSVSVGHCECVVDL
ncbi:hypothetical protein FVEG_17044 [Fusarium verticillioides 7600]|uniref:Uncharacterized protein n=1 Tax=Gibberella moniliformis (strain M3125 / FGSC 7600) TaxID=334819 RepID=W7MPI0_GIBM7|nr:hypothetical protein FVEG_17044 [Fusarium verticillioides 7600]XP_018759169.1 hypothetical protein FVEG_17044 [Fusarium verticillioides 7600]XP_018759170.1 hypothetical protein FVEG_17044 [Fusarium verticillioides 7600]XP_018759171.1 hypothetical protein FVEG_17044 [Fusarium verticillioides 7600]XP_018759172.1 hypothetical protein FVEG_17044 [Fusarium verticillioides 7600]XP_018759173.1 hypothetical protein FVEG_17044 [Fusarium verticillioides 7600]XP_018759174.1 hypothetical protein FVEG_